MFAGGGGARWPLSERPFGFYVMRVEVSLPLADMPVYSISPVLSVPRHILNILSPIQLCMQSVNPLHLLRAPEAATQNGENHLGRRGLGVHLRNCIDGNPARRGNPGYNLRTQ